MVTNKHQYLLVALLVAFETGMVIASLLPFFHACVFDGIPFSAFSFDLGLFYLILTSCFYAVLCLFATREIVLLLHLSPVPAHRITLLNLGRLASSFSTLIALAFPSQQFGSQVPLCVGISVGVQTSFSLLFLLLNRHQVTRQKDQYAPLMQ